MNRSARMVVILATAVFCAITIAGSFLSNDAHAACPNRIRNCKQCSRCDTDLNNDGVVTPTDLLLIATCIRDFPPAERMARCPQYDMNGDGRINTRDFLIIYACFRCRGPISPSA